MTTEVDARMAQRYDTPANWIAQNPVLAAGELGIETTGKFKIGNGSSAWTALPYQANEESFWLF